MTVVAFQLIGEQNTILDIIIKDGIKAERVSFEVISRRTRDRSLRVREEWFGSEGRKVRPVERLSLIHI